MGSGAADAIPLPAINASAMPPVAAASFVFNGIFVPFPVPPQCPTSVSLKEHVANP
jgi:hypothetical protein